MNRPIVLLARPGLGGRRLEFLAIRHSDFRSLYLLEENDRVRLPGGGHARRINNWKSSWACSREDMVDECRS